MKKKFKIVSALFALMLIACLFGCSSETYTYNFDSTVGKTVKGFEQYNYLQTYESDSNATVIEIVSEGHSGNCVRITNRSENDARIYRKISVKPSSYYEISYYVKTVNVEGGNGANVSGYDAQGYSGSLFGTNDWTLVTCYLKTLDNQKSVELSLGLGGYGNISSGIAYFDDLTIKKLSSAPDGEVFSITPNSETNTEEKQTASPILKILFVAVILGAIVFAFVTTQRQDKCNFLNKRQLGETIVRPKKRDLIILCVLTVVTAAYSFFNLGSTKGSPDTYWKSEAAGEYVEFSFTEEQEVAKFVYYTGIERSSGEYEVQYRDKYGEYQTFATITSENIEFYKWQVEEVSFTAQKIRIVVNTPGLWINEIGFYSANEDGSYSQIEIDVASINAEYTETSTSGKPEYWFDEQDEVREYTDYFNSTYFDEIYHPRTAYESIKGLSIYERTHPPLGKDIMALGILIFGMSTLGWRFMGTLAGVLLVPLIYMFALKVFKKTEWATFAAGLIMFDCMRESLTRLATIDSYATLFSVAMVYFMYDYFITKSYEMDFKKSLLPLFLSGLMFGLGAATKWTCLYTGCALAIIFFSVKLYEIIDVKNKRTSIKLNDYLLNNFLPTCLFCVLFFVIIPATIYVLSYIPYMASNPGKSLIKIVLDNQKYMFDYHSQLVATHSFGSPWYSWPVTKRPLFAYINYNVPEGMRQTITLIGNPAIWWVGVPCFFAAVYFAFRNEDKRMGFFAIVYALQYAPWIIVTRVCFIYHYFTPFVFTIFFIVYVFKTLVERNVFKKWMVFAYLGIALILFCMFYPVLTATTVKESYVESLRWFSTWFF